MSYTNLYDYLYRIVIIGDCGVGKTSIVSRITKHNFHPFYDATIGVDYSSIMMPVEDHLHAKCQLWDTAGQESFAPLIKSYYKDITAAIIVFDVNNKRSFDRVKSFWINELKENRNGEHPISILLIGNKTDRNSKRTVDYQEAKDFADSMGFLYNETSAKNDKEHIGCCFKELCRDIHKNIDVNLSIKKPKDSMKLKLNNETEKDRGYYYNCYQCNIC